MKRQADEKVTAQQLYLEIRGGAGHDTQMNRSVKSSPKTATAKRHTPRAWQRMLSGRRLDIIDPSPMDIEIEDIAHGLARVSRWNGQTKGKFPLSVAQHSVIVEKLLHANAPHLDQKWQLATLLHDAPEYVIGDMITPFKAVLGDHYRQIESKLDAAVRIRFGLPATLPDYVTKAIKRADRMAAWLEATQLAGFSEEDANKLFPKPRGTPATMRIRPRPPAEAASQFLRRFDILGGYRK